MRNTKTKKRGKRNREKRNKEITKKFLYMQTRGYKVLEICKKLGKRYFLSEATIYDIVYKKR